MIPHKIWIAQCLCPSRHCILALAFDEAEISVRVAQARLVVQVETAIRDGTIDRWCGLCRSMDWSIEANPTRFATMAEARPHLEAAERANLATRAFLQGVGRAAR